MRSPFTDRDPVLLSVPNYFEQNMFKHPRKVVFFQESYCQHVAAEVKAEREFIIIASDFQPYQIIG